MFSSRTPPKMLANKLTNIIEEKKLSNIPLIDLTVSNPTQVSFDYPESEIIAALANKNSLFYRPDPKGLLVARKAIANYYNLQQVTEENIFLTASTSEAYTLLFKLLMNPGDSVLVPTPSYPLFEHLAQIEGVEAINYHLYFDGAWYIDFPYLQSVCQKNTQAIIIVNPNNPTGSYLKKEELKQLINFCKQNNLALISDEVFYDYPHHKDKTRANSIATIDDVLTFTLNGLSKVAGLPQLKLGWIILNGPKEIFDEAYQRLEFITDLFLSVSSPVQHALPSLLELVPGLQTQIQERVLANYYWLKSQIPVDSVCRLLPTEGGWYAILQVPKILTEEELILELLIKENLIVHPGYFFDFQLEGFLVISLICRPEILQLGIIKLLNYINKLCY